MHEEKMHARIAKFLKLMVGVTRLFRGQHGRLASFQATASTYQASPYHSVVFTSIHAHLGEQSSQRFLLIWDDRPPHVTLYDDGTGAAVLPPS